MQIKSSYIDILKIAAPLVLANLMAGVGQIIDTAFVNRIGENELNGTVMGSMIWMFFTFILLGFSTYIQRLIANNLGSKNYQNIGPIADNFLIIGGTLLGFVMALFFVIKYGGLQWMIREEEIIHFTFVYLDIIILGIPLFILTSFLSAFFSALGRTYVITISIVVYIIVNLFLDYLLIFGNFGFPKMGVTGAALATLIAFFCNFLTYCYFLVKLKIRKEYRLFEFRKIDKKIISHIFSKSMPLVLQNLTNVLVSWIFFVMIEKMGSSELRISFIVRSLYLFICIPFLGLGKAVNTVISNILGQGDMNNLRIAIFKSHVIGIVISILLCSVIAVFSETFLGVYTNDLNEIKEAIPIIKIILIATILFSISMINSNIMIGMGNTRVVFLIGIISMSCYLIFAYVSIFIWKSKITIVWISEWINWGMFMLLSSLYFLIWKTKILNIKFAS